MPVYRDEKTGKYYAKFYYVNWQGEKKQKLKRGFTRQKDAKEFERKFLEQFAKTRIYPLMHCIRNTKTISLHRSGKVPLMFGLEC